MMDTSSIRALLENQKETLRTFGLKRVGIFGSVARGQDKPASDIDLLLDFDPKMKTYKNFFSASSYLENLLKYPVDTVTPQALSPYIAPRVYQDITYVEISN